MESVEIKTYYYDELTPEAQAAAREWYRNTGGYFDLDVTLDEMREAAKLLGINIDHIYYSGFYCKGDGACFTGFYKYKPGSLAAVLKEYPKWKALHKIARDLQNAQKKHFYSISARVSHSGHYYHEVSASFDFEDSRHCYGWTNGQFDESEFTEPLRDFMREIYSILLDEYEHLNSDECVSESLVINEYKFRENGQHWAY